MGVDQKKLPSYSSFIGTVLVRIPFISFTLLHLTSPVCCHALHPSGAQETRGIFGSCASTRFMTSRWGCSNWRPVKSLKWPVSSDKLNTHWGYCHLRKQINWAAQPLEGWTDANVWMDKWNQIFGSRPSKDMDRSFGVWTFSRRSLTIAAKVTDTWRCWRTNEGPREHKWEHSQPPPGLSGSQIAKPQMVQL